VTTTAATTTVVAAATTGTSRIRATEQLVEDDVSPLFFKRLSDESLGSRLAPGEAAAFDELYRRYINRLAAYGSHLLGDATSGDDVAQATMLKAYAALREGRVPARVKPWLFRIAHNTAIDLVVRRRELPSGELPDTPSVDHDPFAGALVEALATLPDRQRRVYVLREVHGLRIDETALELGLTASQVEQSLFAARNRLAEQLVFGDRLNCVTVQRLAAGPLDTPERRALKTHLRTCAACRRTLGVRGRALSLLPSASGLEGLRGLAAGLLSGGAPAAAKVGALVATATIAAGVPVAVEQARPGPAHRTTVHLTGTRTAPRVAPASPVAVPVVARSAVLVHRRVATAGAETRARGERRDDSTEREASGGSTSVEGGSSGDGGSRGSHSGETTSAGSGSGEGSSRDGGSGTDGAVATESPSGSGGGGTSDDGHDATATTSTTETQTTSNESSSGDGSTSGDASGSGDGSGSGSDDHSDESTTTTSVPLAPPPLPVVTAPSGD
jgi:RNA polymerase sigma factor (sigma-70 family)